MGYHDFKHLVYGNKDSGPLSFFVSLNQEGPVRFFFLSFLFAVEYKSS
jgi:hypothetical protein